MARQWRLFALLNAVGVLLFTFGTIDGHPITEAFTPVGIFLLLPGFVVSIAMGPYIGRAVAHEQITNFVAALPAVGFNALAWYLFFRVMRQHDN